MEKSNIFTNAIGTILILLAVTGVIFRWWTISQEFTGSWTEIISVFVTGAVFIGGMSDDFIRDIRSRFKKGEIKSKE